MNSGSSDGKFTLAGYNRLGCVAFALVLSGTAQAQSSTNCIDMGGGSAHCDTMNLNGTGQASTNCMDMGGGMVHCDTMNMGGGYQPPPNDSGAKLGRGLANLITRHREHAFRKKVGRMLADGDCDGAVSYAYKKGRLEFGRKLSRSCSRDNSVAPAQQQPESSPIWVKYAESITGSVFYYDKSAIYRHPKTTNVLVMVDQALDKTEKYPKRKALYMLQCKENSYATMMLTLYDTGDRIVRSYLAPELRFQPVTSGSVQTVLMKVICESDTP